MTPTQGMEAITAAIEASRKRPSHDWDSPSHGNAVRCKRCARSWRSRHKPCGPDTPFDLIRFRNALAVAVSALDHWMHHPTETDRGKACLVRIAEILEGK